MCADTYIVSWRLQDILSCLVFLNIKVFQTTMIYLLFIEIYKSLSSTEMHLCSRCSVRAAHQHNGTPELELVRK